MKRNYKYKIQTSRIAILLFFLTTVVSFGQAVRLSDKPEQFMTEVQKLMATGGPVAVRAGTNLQSLWSENKLSPQQQERIMALSRKLNQKRLQPATHFAPFYEALYQASQQQTASATTVDGILTIAEKLFEANDPKAFTRSLETARRFMERHELYASNYNKLYALGGTFEFRYVGNVPTVSQPGVPPTAADSIASVKASIERSRFDGWDTPSTSDSTQPRSLGVQYTPQRRPIPSVSGAVITLKDVTLAMIANGDSAVLSNTNGDLMLKDGMLVGNGGKFTWATAGRPDIYVTLSEYSLTTMNPRIQADDVTLTYGTTKPIKGVFEYVSKKKGGPVTYPRFMSWQNDVKLPDLGPDIDYRGGLALSGTQMVGASASGQPAQLTIKYNGKTAFKASSRRFDFSSKIDSASAGLTQPAIKPDSTQNGGFNTSGFSGTNAAKSLISANSASFVGYVDTDSVTHPSVKFRYDKNQHIAWLDREQRTDYARVPYSDSYHKFYILPEVVRWDLPRRKVDFYQVGAKQEVPVRFESFDYFHPQRYSDLTVDYGFHPLQIVANYVSTKKQQTFLESDIVDFTKANKVSPVALRGALNRMVLEGYLDRDANSGLMHLSRKGALYVLAYAQKRDYDNFQVQSYFPSNDSTKNATINLDDKMLTIRGVERFNLSDSLKIFGIPSDKTLRIGKGRAFTLNGQLKAGTLRYAGRDLRFDYDKFAMNLNKIDSITFSSQKLPGQEMGGDIKYENPGTVYLSSADNKSGRIAGKKATQRLVMPEGMTVYFNQPARGDRTYDQKVYFKIPAVDNDSLGKGDIAFMGTFYSDGIFPPFKAELKTMPDNTLGFVHKAPATGYPIYSGKKGSAASTVKFTGDLTMDKSGLHADGVLNHLTASLNAKNMLFMTDSLTGAGEKGEIKETLAGQAGPSKAYFPQVQLNNYTMKWWPKADSMVIVTQKKNFNFYNATTNLDGDLVLRSSGLFGHGILRRKDSEVISGSIKFNREGFLASNAQFKVLSDKVVNGTATVAKPMLLGTAIDVDFNQTKGIVGLSINKNLSITDTVQSSLEFPSAAYKTSISKAQWNINAKTIAMKGDVKTSTFTATAEEQEGLTFNGSGALYDVEKMTLNISGVPYVTSADARIYPDKGLVSIKRNGEMLALKNAKLELDTVSLFHRLKNGNIQILSRTRFTGDATYQFATAKGDTASIKMGSFELKEAPAVAASTLTADTKKSGRGRKNATQPATTYFTVARAEVDEDDNLQLAPKMLYKGTISMQAPQPDLAMDGFIKPALKKRQDLVGGWIPFKEKVAERLEIKVDKNLKNEGGQQLVAGIHFREGNAGLYPTFLSPKEDPRDVDLFTATGIMHYDEKDKVYRIESKGSESPAGQSTLATAVAAAAPVDSAKTDLVAKVDSTAKIIGTDSTAKLVGTDSTAHIDSSARVAAVTETVIDDVENAFTFNDSRGLMTFKGKLNLLNAAPNEYLLASGSARINIDSTQYRFNTLLAFTFPVPDPINTAIGDRIVKANLEEKNDEAADDDLNRLSDKLVPLIGQQAVDAYRLKAQNQHAPLSQASPKLATTLVLANANLRWSTKFNAFYSTGQLGVSNIMATDVNAQMDGFIEIRKSANGDEATIYLESSPDVWVYYDYKPGSTPSSQGELAIITSEQEINDQLIALKQSSKSSLDVMAATVDEKTLFVDRYLDQYKTKAKAAPKPKLQPGQKVVKEEKKKDEKKKDKEAEKEGF
ncbi:hypothetical protein [Spirosoma endophyticum]|uniref:Uncharacterized protein n=1 Tax=Spirosoma endophyticum TaxID=662367 RepID=A0A1I1WV65_9BACT|nr:hypothetical protein [Spirosoma endophyticum]SFD99074.1 hypothetical protein SAMN05216167_10985 [Spirosoma endophyticum]